MYELTIKTDTEKDFDLAKLKINNIIHLYDNNMGIKWIYDDALKLFVFYDKLYTDMAVYTKTEALINRKNNIQINFKIMKHLTKSMVL